MKKLLLLAGAFLALSTAQAQYYLVPHPNAGTNPGIFNNDGEYPLGTSGAQTGWTTIHDATSNAIVWAPVVNLPGSFNFKFNNQVVSAWKASTSGVVTFTTSATAVPPTANVALPSPLIPDKSLCVWGMGPQAADKIAYKMFGAAPNRQLWIQYNSYTTPGTNPAGWTYWSIVLEEGTHKIYFVDQKTANGTIALTVGLQIDATTAFQLPNSPAVASLAGNGGTPADNSYYEFVYGTQPAFDMEVKVVDIPPKVALSRAPFTVSGKLLSNGATTVTNFNINYKVGNNPTVTAPITNVSIPSNANYEFTHPVKWNPSALGSYSMKVWASSINGNADLNTSNDTAFVFVDVEQSPRTVLHEVFTSSTCPPCLPGNTNLKSITEANPGMSIDIKYQQQYPGNPLGTGPDPYSTQEARNRHTVYYGINSIPRMEVDGGWNSNANSYTAGLLNTFFNNPTNVLVDGTYSINGNTVTANAVVTPFANVASNNLVVHMVITEKHTTQNARSNGETDFYDVMKKMMPNENGTPIAALVSGQPVTVSQTYTFPATNTVENFQNLQVVVFVQDNSTKQVLNAFYAKNTALSAVTKNIDPINLNVFPNPTNGTVNVTYTAKPGETAGVTVYNMIGEKVFVQNLNTTSGQLNIDLSGQAAGVYLLNLQLGDKMVTKKISLLK